MSNFHIVVGGGSGIGKFLVNMILKCSKENILIIDNYNFKIQKTKRLIFVKDNFSKEINLKKLLPQKSKIKSISFLIPQCKPREKDINKIGFTSNFIENVGMNNAALLHLISSAIPYFCNASSIVLVSSILANRVAIGDATLDYHASKAVLESITRYMSAQLAPKTMINCLSPALIARNNKSALLTQTNLRNAIKISTPLGRPYQQKEIARAIWSLASGQLGFVTGQTIVMDGGSSVLEPFSIARSMASKILRESSKKRILSD